MTEVEILEEGNIFIGKKEGTAISEDGTNIFAQNFYYDKSKNLLIASGNVKLVSDTKNITIFQIKLPILKMMNLFLLLETLKQSIKTVK